MDGGTWLITVHRVTKSRTRLSDFTFTQLIYNVVCTSGVQQSESALRIHIYPLFIVLDSFPKKIEERSLCSTVGPCLLAILYTEMCICQSQSPSLSLPSLPLLSTSVTLLLFCK